MDKATIKKTIIEGARQHRKGLLKPGRFVRYGNYCSLKFLHITAETVEHWIGYSDGFALGYSLLASEPNRQTSTPTLF